MHECLVCNRKLTGTHWLCHSCYNRYGRLADWPGWLKALHNIEQENRRYAAESGEYEVDFVPLSNNENHLPYVPELRTT